MFVLDLLTRDYLTDHKFSLSTISATGVVSILLSFLILDSSNFWFISYEKLTASNNNMLLLWNLLSLTINVSSNIMLCYCCIHYITTSYFLFVITFFCL